MPNPSQTTLRIIMTQHATNDGYKKLREMGYTMSRQVCRDMRNELRDKGVVDYKRTTWTAERVETVRKMVREGKTSRLIGLALDVSPKRVYDVCHRLGIPLTKGAPIKSLPDRDKLNAVYQVNSIARTADIFGVSEKVASRWVSAYGLKRLNAVEPTRRHTAAKSPTPPRSRSFRLADLPPPEAGPAAEAARYLRRQGYANVYRRSEKEWWVGRGPMAEADMIARAAEIEARKGRMRA